jgi:hypothetical protein
MIIKNEKNEIESNVDLENNVKILMNMKEINNKEEDKEEKEKEENIKFENSIKDDELKDDLKKENGSNYKTIINKFNSIDTLISSPSTIATQTTDATLSIMANEEDKYQDKYQDRYQDKYQDKYHNNSVDSIESKTTLGHLALPPVINSSLIKNNTDYFSVDSTLMSGRNEGEPKKSEHESGNEYEHENEHENGNELKSRNEDEHGNDEYEPSNEDEHHLSILSEMKKYKSPLMTTFSPVASPTLSTTYTSKNEESIIEYGLLEKQFKFFLRKNQLGVSESQDQTARYSDSFIHYQNVDFKHEIKK